MIDGSRDARKSLHSKQIRMWRVVVPCWQKKDPDFAVRWLHAFSQWLTILSADKVGIGTSHPISDHARSFSYIRQATLLVEYTPAEMRIVDIYLSGQDWLA